MSVDRVKDKKGEGINEGDNVWTKYRGGSHEGEVSHTYHSVIRQPTDRFLGRKDSDGPGRR